MITRDLWKLYDPANPVAASYGRRERCEEWRKSRLYDGRPAEAWLIERVPCCACCGADFSDVRERNGSITEWPNGQVRCDRHHDRNPCIVEGCGRTVSATCEDGVTRIADDQAICGQHWRRFVPPRSRARRAYNAHWRRGKKLGWSPKRTRAFDRFWDTLVIMVRRRAEGGFLDEREISSLFGWDQAA